MRNHQSLPKLLRAIASATQAQENKHDIILIAAAKEIEQLRNALQEIADMEGDMDLDDHKFAESALRIANDALK